LKRRRIPGLIDQVEVDSPEEISSVVQDPRAGRQFYTPTALMQVTHFPPDEIALKLSTSLSFGLHKRGVEITPFLGGLE